MSASIAVHSADFDPEPPEARRIAVRFTQLAGSEENALALVLALRNGVAVQLVRGPEGEGDALPEVVALEVPTAPMSWNDVRVSLLHAQDILVHAGLTRPDLEELHAALLGGVVHTAEGRAVTLRGVLNMRVDGLTWVDIARVSAQPGALGAR